MKQKLLLIIIISIAFAYIESSVVVYLRNLYYPEGFSLPLKPIEGQLLLIELGRELATIALLLGVALLAGRTLMQRFAYFSFAFGLWDIFYYIWLKIFINWPESFLTWDLLFLIPIPWIGPVLSPVLVSVSLICTALILVSYDNSHRLGIRLTKLDWAGEILAASIILLSYLWNFTNMDGPAELLSYPWWLFISGMALGLYIFYSRAIIYRLKV